MKTLTKTTLAALTAAALIALPAASSQAASSGQSVSSASAMVRVTQKHFKVAAGTQKLNIILVGQAGANYELYLSRGASGSKQIMLASSRLPKSGRVRLSFQLGNRLPNMNLFTQAEASLSVSQI